MRGNFFFRLNSVVSGKQAGFTLAQHAGPVFDLDFRNHPPTNARGAGVGLLLAFCATLPHGCRLGRRTGRRRA